MHKTKPNQTKINVKSQGKVILDAIKHCMLKQVCLKIKQVTKKEEKKMYRQARYRCHLPKHFSIDDVRDEERNFHPVDPPGK